MGKYLAPPFTLLPVSKVKLEFQALPLPPGRDSSLAFGNNRQNEGGQGNNMP
jgi:hypothetical protein